MLEEYCTRLCLGNKAAFPLVVSDSQRAGTFSRRLLRSMWDLDNDAIRMLPRTSEEDDWVRLPGYECNTSALWVALCEIIAPRLLFERGNRMGHEETQLLFLLIHRRPGGPNAKLRGCVHVFHTHDDTWSVGSLKKSMHPLSAVLYLAQVICESDVGRLDPRQPCRAAECMRCLILAGATTENMDWYQVRKAFRNPRCQKALRVLLNEGQLCVMQPELAITLFLRFGEQNVALASAFSIEAEDQHVFALAWAMLSHVRLGGARLSCDLVRMIGEPIFPLCGFYYSAERKA